MLLQDVLVSAGMGSVIGRLMIHHSERPHGKEWPAMRVRQVEAKWITAGIATGLVAQLLLS